MSVDNGGESADFKRAAPVIAPVMSETAHARLGLAFGGIAAIIRGVFSTGACGAVHPIGGSKGGNPWI